MGPAHGSHQVAVDCNRIFIEQVVAAIRNGWHDLQEPFGKQLRSRRDHDADFNVALISLAVIPRLD
jgi:hypothetical protein